MGPFFMPSGKEGIPVATRERKLTPTAIKKLEGNPGKRKLNDREPKPEKKAPLLPEVAGTGGKEGVAQARQKDGNDGRAD